MEMAEQEKAYRLTILAELFMGFGISDEGRIRFFANKTSRIPCELFAGAVDRAVLTNESGFIPSPGQIMKAALAISPRQRSEMSGQLSTPRWYRVAIGEARERPKETGSRIGEGTLTTAALEAVVGGE